MPTEGRVILHGRDVTDLPRPFHPDDDPGKLDLGRLARALGSEINGVIDINLVRTDGQRIESMREPVPHFEKHAFKRQA